MIHFADRALLYAIPVIFIAAVFLAFLIARLRRKRILAFMEERFIPHLIDPLTFRLQTVKAVLLLLSVLFILLSLARPQWGEKKQNVQSRGLDIIIAVDTSTSMLAEDQKPNRLERAKHALDSFVSLLRGDRVGIITFAGTSFLSCPLTLDYDAAKMYLSIIDEYSIPVPGTDLAEAIRQSIRAFEVGENKYKVLVLLTDGENHDADVLEAAKEAKQAGIVIYAVGIGSPTGEPIPLRDQNGVITGYKKDKEGKIVTSRLDEETLIRIASLTGGKYYNATDSERELALIHQDIERMEKKDLKSSLLNRYEDQFPWFLFPAFILLLVEMILPERSWSFDWSRLSRIFPWRRKRS
jgi:Ca-activated chloride channel family protein